jgi:hypothetical protein
LLDRLSTLAIRFLRAVCFVIAVGLPLGVLYDRLQPSEGALKELARYAPGVRLCVGYGVRYTAQRVDGALQGTWYRQRVFVILPDVFRTPRAIEITRDPAGNVTAEQSSVLLLFLGAIYAASIWGAWSLRSTGPPSSGVSDPKRASPARTA